MPEPEGGGVGEVTNRFERGLPPLSLLEQEGFALPWMEDRKEIEAVYKRAHESLQRTWQWKQEQLSKGENSPLVEGEWRQAVARFSEASTALNKKIDAYNLSIPADILYRPRINTTREIDLITGK